MTQITLHQRRTQGGAVIVLVALLVASVVFGYLATVYGGAIHARSIEKQVRAAGALERIARQAMDTYARNSYDIEREGAERAAWLNAPDRLLAGVNEPALAGRVGVAISPVRQYAGDTDSDRGQYFAFTRAVVYILDDAQGARDAAPAFDEQGVFMPCGGLEPAACNYRHQTMELPIASFQADRLAEAVTQVQRMASRLTSFFNTHMHLDPLRNMSLNRFRDGGCANPGAGQHVAFGHLPCLEGFERIDGPGASIYANVLVQTLGVSGPSMREYQYPWGGPEAGSLIELANEEGAISGSTLANNVAYPYSMAVRQPLPWPSITGEPLYVVAYALQP